MKRWWAIAVEVWNSSLEDDVFGKSAELSYYFLLAAFPFLLFLTTLLGFVALGDEVYSNLLSYAASMLPDPAFKLVTATLDQVRSGAGGAKLSFGIMLTISAASSGMAAMIN